MHWTCCDKKAKRGELIVTAPARYVKGEGRLEKDPDRRVQERVLLVFISKGSLRRKFNACNESASVIRLFIRNADRLFVVMFFNFLYSYRESIPPG